MQLSKVAEQLAQLLTPVNGMNSTFTNSVWMTTLELGLEGHRAGCGIQIFAPQPSTPHVQMMYLGKDHGIDAWTKNPLWKLWPEDVALLAAIEDAVAPDRWPVREGQEDDPAWLELEHAKAEALEERQALSRCGT